MSTLSSLRTSVQTPNEKQLHYPTKTNYNLNHNYVFIKLPWPQYCNKYYWIRDSEETLFSL